MLKARVEDNPVTWDEHLDFCMMAYRSRVHSSTGHTPFELMFVREMRKPLDVMVGGAEDNECSYTDFITDLEGIYKQRIEMSGKTLRWPSDARRMPMTRE